MKAVRTLPSCSGVRRRALACHARSVSPLLANVFEAQLTPESYRSLDDGDLVATGAYKVSEFAEGAVDVWGAEPGYFGGVAADEIFVVLKGRAELTFDETGERITIGPGDIVRLHAGKRNTWRTLETIRKVSFYVPPQG